MTNSRIIENLIIIFGISVIIFGVIGLTREFLRESNRILISNTLISEAVVVVGYFEPLILGLPLIVGFIIGVFSYYYFKR